MGNKGLWQQIKKAMTIRPFEERERAYVEALREIEEAKETGATELDLGCQGLTKIPPELFQLKQLVRLDLGYNELIVLQVSDSLKNFFDAIRQGVEVVYNHPDFSLQGSPEFLYGIQ
ncbi:MAG: leucine-rich repeat domain-containing protein, partial [Candidatus Electrothrix sp. LOE2]|nr:leucine-rich repeat domain-containing protein [Candidatus Electrothrix sp. LOE2]